MSRNKHTLPLVFALAVAVDAGNANAEILRADAVLQPGSLAGLLDTFQLSLPTEPKSSSDVGGQFDRAQWGNFPNFPNFYNCFSGNWRNC